MLFYEKLQKLVCKCKELFGKCTWIQSISDGVWQESKVLSNFINKLPALEGKTIGEVMKRYLTGLQETWKVYLAAESPERIQKALRKQIRPKGEFKQGECCCDSKT